MSDRKKMTTTEEFSPRSMPTENIIMTTTEEEIEINSISFRQSLKFFQEQLITNKRLPVIPRMTNKDSKNKYRTPPHNVNDKANGLDSDIQVLNSYKISIPTVDTILESVRVLRAIQKKQAEQGAEWTLDMTSTTDVNHNRLAESLCNPLSTAEDNLLCEENLVSQDNSSESCKKETDAFETALSKQPCRLGNRTEEEALYVIADNHAAMEIYNSSDNTCPFWPSNILKQETYMTYDVKETAQAENELTYKKSNTLEENETCRVENTQLEYGNENNCEMHKKIEDNVVEHNRENNSLLNEDETNTIKEDRSENSNGDCRDKCLLHNSDTANKESLHAITFTEEDILNIINRGNTEISCLRSIMHIEGTKTSDENILIDDFMRNKSTDDEDLNYDSGTATEAISCSPTTMNEIRLQSDSCSDTYASQYVSSEYSPFLSLSSVDGLSPGSNSSMSNTITEAFSDDATEKDTQSNEEIQSSNKNEHTESDLTLSSRSTEICDTSTELCINKNNDETDVNREKSEDSEITSMQLHTNLHSKDDNQNEKKVQGENFESYIYNKEIPKTDVLSSEQQISKAHSEEPQNNLMHGEQESETLLFATNCEIYSNEAAKTDPEISINTVSEKTININNNNEEIHIKNIENGSTKFNIQSSNFKNNENPCDTHIQRMKKVTGTSYNIISILKILYGIKECSSCKIFPERTEFLREVFVLSKGAFCGYPEGIYELLIEKSTLYIKQGSTVLLTLSLNYGSTCIIEENVLMVDNRLGRCVFLKNQYETDISELKDEIDLHCQKYWESDCLNLVQYPLKCNKNVVIIDLGSSSIRAGILMDQPTLPSIFFPTICAKNRVTGECVYGMEALQPEVRQNSTLSFPMRPSAKIIKHTIDVSLMEGLFKKVLRELRIEPSRYTIQICLPRSLNIGTQNEIVKLLLENLNVAAVSLTNQALLTLYAHDVSTAIIVDIGDRMDILPVVDGFIVENGVTRLPYGGQRLIHHMKHALAEKHMSLSNDIDSYVVQYIIENLLYIAEDYATEVNMMSQHPSVIQKSISLQSFAFDSSIKQSITLDDARFKIPEGLFKPEMWGLDNPGVHQLVQKAIQATSVDARTKVAENIYISGGVTLLPGFAERLNNEVSKLNKTKATPKVYASNYRYHCAYIGACKFANMEEFQQVCVHSSEYSKNGLSSLKKFVLCF